MIDDNKIEEAASTYGTSNGYSCIGPDGRMSLKPELETAFETGAHWAINEFLKDLLHPASEKPKRRFNYLLLHYKDEEEECFEADVVDTKAWDLYIKDSLVEYINIDDLFVKKEYGHD